MITADPHTDQAYDLAVEAELAGEDPWDWYGAWPGPCPACTSSESSFLGRLGTILFYRCRDCAMDFRSRHPAVTR